MNIKAVVAIIIVVCLVGAIYYIYLSQSAEDEKDSSEYESITSVVLRPNSVYWRGVEGFEPDSWDNWKLIDDVVADDDETVMYPVTSSVRREIYSFTQETRFLDKQIVSMMVCFRATIGDTVGEEESWVRPLFLPWKYGNIVYENGGMWKTYSQTWDSSPFTGQSWTWDEINNVHLGLQALAQVGEETRITQLYVVVVFE